MRRAKSSSTPAGRPTAPVSPTSAPGEFADLWCEERLRQGAAYQRILEQAKDQVGWAYEVWETVLDQLADRNNRNRSIAAQILCRLAKSDPAHRLLRDFPILFDVVADERFVTARHALQAMWEVGCVGQAHQEMLVAALERHFESCRTHKNATLIRYDIIQCLRKLFDTVGDETIRTRALALIERENDPKYRKKYATLWPKQRTS